MRERNSNSRMVLRTTAGGGDGFAVVLDFEFLAHTLRHANNEEICPRSSSLYVLNSVTSLSSTSFHAALPRELNVAIRLQRR